MRRRGAHNPPSALIALALDCSLVALIIPLKGTPSSWLLAGKIRLAGHFSRSVRRTNRGSVTVMSRVVKHFDSSD